MRKKIFAVAAFMCAIICVAGVNAFFRDISQTPGKAIPNLILAVVCALLTVLSVRKIRNPARRTASVQKASPSKPLTAKAIQPEMRIPNPADLISIHTEHIDPDEGLKTPAWAELSISGCPGPGVLERKTDRLPDPVVLCRYRFWPECGTGALLPAEGRLSPARQRPEKH